MQRRLTLLILAALLVWPSSSCGTVIFQHRHGQEGGRLDPNVVLLDGVALLFFVLPGLLAFAVDFTSGSIYLPEDVEKGEGPFIWDSQPDDDDGEAKTPDSEG